MHSVGQLDDHHADIVDHRQQHFAEALGLAILGGEKVQLAELGDAVDAARDFFAEALPDLFDGDDGVFDDVVQQASRDRDAIHAHVGEDVGDHQRVQDIRLARVAQLPLVIFGSEGECFVHRRQIVFGTGFEDLGFQFGEELGDGIRRRLYRDSFRQACRFGGH